MVLSCCTHVYGCTDGIKAALCLAKSLVCLLCCCCMYSAYLSGSFSGRLLHVSRYDLFEHRSDAVCVYCFSLERYQLG